MGLISGVASLFPANTVVGKLGRGEVPTGSDLKKAVTDAKKTLKTGVIKIGNPALGKSVNIKNVKATLANGGLASLNNPQLKSMASVNNAEASKALATNAIGQAPTLETGGDAEVSGKVSFPLLPVLVVGGVLYYLKSKNKI